MAVQSISSVINASFVRSFQGLSSSGAPALGARATSGPTISSGLRLGARTFATAIQNLNATIGIVNVAENTLKQLSKLTDKMIDIAQRGTSLSAGAQTRRGLQAEFEDVVVKFRRIVEDSELNSVEYLTQEGLSALFQRIGLDQETSDGVASIFRKFIENEEDDSLASEATKGPRPPEVPSLKRSRVSQVSDSNIYNVTTGISPENSTYVDNVGGSFYRPISVASDGTTSYAAALGDALEVMAINETKGGSESAGYVLVMGAEDYTYETPTIAQQLYLFAPNGTVARRISDTDIGDYPDFSSYLSADISADNLTAIYSFTTAGSGDFVSIKLSGALNSPPSLATSYTYSGTAYDLKISNDGQYVLYNDGVNSYLAPTSGDIFSTRQDLGYLSNNYGFADSDTVIFRDNSGSGIYSLSYGDPSATLLVSDPTVSSIAVLETDGSYTQNDGSGVNTPNIATLAFLSSTSTTNKLTVTSFDINAGTLKTRYRRELGAGTVEQISLSYQNDLNTFKDRVDVGVRGTLSTLFGDSDRELYRISETRFASNNSLFAQASSDPTSILDQNLMTRADSYRLLGDLKALKQQMKDNIEALSDARDYLADNVSLVRTAGFAFLEISNQLTGTEDANRVAQMVATEIRKNASTAQLAQVENLRNIATETVGLLS